MIRKSFKKISGVRCFEMFRVETRSMGCHFSWGQALLLGLLLVAMTASGAVSPVNAITALAETNPPAASQPLGPSLEVRLAEARTNLAAAEVVSTTAGTNASAGLTPQDIALRRAMLQRLVRLLEQKASNVGELEVAVRRRTEVTRAAQAWTRFTEPVPYSILLTDRLREEIQAEQAKIASSTSTTATIDQLIGENREMLAQAEEAIRRFNEQLESEANSAAITRISWQRDLERLRSQMAAAGVSVLETERQLRQEAVAESRARLELLQRQLIVADASVKFTQADLDLVKARLEKDRQQLEVELSAAMDRSRATQAEVETARNALRAARARPETPPAELERSVEKAATRETELECLQAITRMLRFILESENVERAMWELRFAAHDSRSVEVLNESERRLEGFLSRTDLWKDFQQQQQEKPPTQIELQEARLRSLPPDSELLPLVRERLAALQERAEWMSRLMQRMDQVRRLSDRWAEELRVARGRLPFLGRVQSLGANTGSLFKKLWTFELFTAEDTITVEGQKITGMRSITLGKVAMAILILAVGIWITGLISRLVEPVIVRRLKIEPNQANLIRRWLRAFLVVCLILFSLTSVKIPLTVFAFAGGALAIGLGFGMQTLLKNFVSGLIILFERPFRVGDVLDVSGQQGTVTSVGLRASVLQLGDGTETLIPNSTLLEENLTNWTYSNRKVRFIVAVGVAYGSDPRRVAQALNEVAERHGLVEKEPKPQVMFTNFGDSTLNFELRFWVDVTQANSAQVASDLRLMIVSSFTELGINIAFPQRDMNLRATEPILVAMVPAADAGASTKPSADAKGDESKPNPIPEKPGGAVP
ncbi:MAG: mechanosensitive ion channel [Verrucomicrobiota bacterium]